MGARVIPLRMRVELDWARAEEMRAVVSREMIDHIDADYLEPEMRHQFAEAIAEKLEMGHVLVLQREVDRAASCNYGYPATRVYVERVKLLDLGNMPTTRVIKES